MAEELSLVIEVRPAHDPRPALELRVPPELFMEVAHDLRGEGVFLGTPVTASAGIGDLTVLVASVGGGLGGVAAVITAVTARHRHRRVMLTNRNGATIGLSGMSQHEMNTRLNGFLGAEHGKQEEIRHLYEFPGWEDLVEEE